MQTTQDKEQLIVGTILECGNEIKKFLNESNLLKSNDTKLFESSKLSIYKYNMLNLYSNIINEPFVNLDESKIVSHIKNNRNNYFAYFNKVNEFLNGFELGIQKSLNESLNVDDKKIKNPLQINITTFKDDLKKIIETLSKQNDIQNYSEQILKIKTFTKQPVFVCGYNICNNIALMQELQSKFNILYQNLLAVCFNQNTKQLYFVTNNTNNLVVYDLSKDILDLYNKVNQPIAVKILDANNYLETLKELTGINAITEVYVNSLMLNFKFQDNLYHDVAYNNFRQTITKNNIVK